MIWVIILGCVIALIYINKRAKALEKELPAATTVAVAETGKSAPTKEEVCPSQHILYSYKSSVTRMRCPFCDGENQYSARSCIICGRDLS